MNVKKLLLCGCLLFVVYLILAGGGLAHTATSAAGVAQSLTLSMQQPENGSSWDITSAPQLSPAKLESILTTYHSPMVGLGEYIYDLGHRYHINSDFALAFWLHESTLGTVGEATLTFSPGNLRCVADRACVDQQRGGYAQMRSWQDGIEHWYKLIALGYVQGQVTKSIVGSACNTLAQIIPIYAPASDKNNEQAYIEALIYTITAWRAGKVVA